MTCPGTAWVVTRFPSGAAVEAHPQHGPEDVARAEALGYPHVGAGCLDHDPLHVVVAEVLGTPTLLRSLAEGKPVDPELAGAEEAVVLAVQRYLNVWRAKGAVA